MTKTMDYTPDGIHILCGRKVSVSQRAHRLFCAALVTPEVAARPFSGHCEFVANGQEMGAC